MNSLWVQGIFFTLVVVFTIITVEIIASLLMRRQVYSLQGVLTNLSAYFIYLVIAAVYGYGEYLVISYVQLLLAIQPLPVNWWYWLLIMLLDDFSFYWFHRMSHKFGLLWLSHVVHHSSNEFNLSVGLRQTWLPFLGVFFWLPTAFLGFRAEHILLIQAASLSYQFLMHTQLFNLPRYVGWLMNTPSHHRAHHGTNAQYIDKNFAGVLVIWDKIFGTFEPEKEAVQFGIDNPAPRGEVFFIQLHAPIAYMQNLVKRVFRPAEQMAAMTNYAAQHNSLLLTIFFFFVSLAVLVGAIFNPRWFM